MPGLFNVQLAKNIKKQYDNVVNNNLASLVVIDGRVGGGKTTLAVQIADLVNEFDKKKPIALESNDHPQISMGGSEFMKQIPICYEQGYHVLIYDEAGDYAKINFMSSLNKALHSLFDKYRAFKIMVILCLPNMAKLDSSLFQNQLIRGVIHIYGKNEKAGYAQFKAYSSRRAHYIRDKMKKMVIPQQAYDKTYPNFYGRAYKLEADRQTKLDNLSTKTKLVQLKQQRKKVEGLYTFEEAMNKLGLTATQMRSKINYFRLKGERDGRFYYYNQNHLDTIKQALDKKVKVQERKKTK